MGQPVSLQTLAIREYWSCGDAAKVLGPGHEKPTTKGKSKMKKAVLVTTEHRGVFFGYVAEDQDMAARTMGIDGARCAIYWATKTGIAELAAVGPNSNSRVGSRANIVALHDITAVWECSPEAVSAWEAAK